MKQTFCLLLCAFSHELYPSKPSTPRNSELPFQVISHSPQKFDSKKTYIIGCDVTTSDISTGIFEVVHHKPKIVLELKTATKTVTNFTEYFTHVMSYLEKEHALIIKQACFASPGNTSSNKDYIKHDLLAFAVDGREIKKHTKLENIMVVNDFEVVGYGIQAIDQKHIKTLHEGKPREHGTKLIIGAGNGLGTGLMLWNEKWENYTPSPISWSFVEFSPESELDLKLNTFLQTNTGSRSWGKVLGAGGGILKLYEFLNMQNIYETTPIKYATYQEIFDNYKTDKRCADAVNLYMKLNARLVRNVTYAQLPYSGVYITNSVAENNPDLFTARSFIDDVFKTDNGYLSNYLSEIPIYLVEKHDGLRMYGAALYSLVYQPLQK